MKKRIFRPPPLFRSPEKAGFWQKVGQKTAKKWPAGTVFLPILTRFATLKKELFSRKMKKMSIFEPFFEPRGGGPRGVKNPVFGPLDPPKGPPGPFWGTPPGTPPGGGGHLGGPIPHFWPIRHCRRKI